MLMFGKKEKDILVNGLLKVKKKEVLQCQLIYNFHVGVLTKYYINTKIVNKIKVTKSK